MKLFGGNRSRVNWIKCGDLNNKFFIDLPAHPGTKNIFGISLMKQVQNIVDNKQLRNNF
jgi:hypothetical protein